MSSLSGKDTTFYKLFKNEATKKTIKSVCNKNTIDVIKFRGKTYISGSYHHSFITDKKFIINELKNKPILAVKKTE